MSPSHDAHVLSRRSWPEWRRISALLRTESVGGILLLIATVLALICANTNLAEHYFALRDSHLGFQFGSFNVNLSIGHWAADGLLAVFFFMAGLELKQEFVAGDLRNPSRAIIPVAAAFGGVVVPAVIFCAINFGDADAAHGWAIPTATDIAFALAVLAVIGSHLPSAMRTFLLTLAIVDDLIAITIIAIFYTSDLNVGYLLAALVPVVIYAVIARHSQRWFRLNLWASWFLLLPIGVIAWALLLNSGVHATIAGVVLAFTLPVRPHTGSTDTKKGLAHMMEHHVRPFSAGVCVPVFAFFSAGVSVGGFSGLANAITSPIAYGVILGLVGGKIIGIFVTTFALTRIRQVNLNPDLAWIDVLGLAAIAGIGFTVSLLVCELSYGQGSALDDMGKVGILLASVLAAILASAILIPRNRHYALIEAYEKIDTDADGIPDVYDDDPYTPNRDLSEV